ncbi:hypothetical protein [Candidatus Leptofilum sp.]|uniref:hypothetical protein n=1 Tax=Candidatus Leptofilum sp. TaxID=3241576 RepID=UPI003B5955F6
MLSTVMQPQHEQMQDCPHLCQPITETFIYDNPNYVQLSGRLRTELDQLQLSVAEVAACEDMRALWSETAVTMHTTCEFVTISC